MCALLRGFVRRGRGCLRDNAAVVPGGSREKPSDPESKGHRSCVAWPQWSPISSIRRAPCRRHHRTPAAVSDPLAPLAWISTQPSRLRSRDALAGGRVKIPDRALAIAIPDKFEGQVRPRSGLAARTGVTVLNSPRERSATPTTGERCEVLLVNLSDAFPSRSRPSSESLSWCWRPSRVLSSSLRSTPFAVTVSVAPAGYGSTGA